MAIRKSSALPPGQLPKLTEVLDAERRAKSHEMAPMAEANLVPEMAPTAPAALRGPGTGFDEALFTQQLLAELQQQIDAQLEQRLRDGLAPALARVENELVAELRQDLSAALPEMVAHAVAKALARRRER